MPIGPVGKMPVLLKLPYGVAVGMATAFGGGGGVIRQSINFHTASTSNAVMIAATNCRVGVKLFRERVDPLRQREVEIGQAAFAMGRKDESHFVKANVDIRMVLLFLRHFSDSVHKIDCVGEIVELERALDVLFLQLPLGHLLQSNFCFIGFDQIRHIGRMSNTRNLFCKRRLFAGSKSDLRPRQAEDFAQIPFRIKEFYRDGP